MPLSYYFDRATAPTKSEVPAPLPPQPQHPPLPPPPIPLHLQLHTPALQAASISTTTIPAVPSTIATPFLALPALSPVALSPVPSPPPQHTPEMSRNARHLVFYNPRFKESSPTGLQYLLKYSMPDAFYNSNPHYPPPKCYLGTRMGNIALFITGALGDSDQEEPILRKLGLFGVGKSAVARSCAEALAPTKNSLPPSSFPARMQTATILNACLR
ncbi:hypothetical protein D9756_002849 [Leucocoprinus leucothites]|uniref:Uncharacterized protein n=1 Tax=Leucocoprinus leucothites TaxID=201217 RepID=A0A8H5GBX1_9AGAR|nr:hypothetical protein D9756_002849 [Leucoagaricus leucothites]